MNRLSLHVLSLLRLYDSVAMPGVGYFRMEYVPAHYDPDVKVFFPPFYSLSFLPSFEADDNRLLDSYIRKEHVSPDTAWEEMKEDIDNFLDELDDNGEVYLPGLGTFTVEEDDDLAFFSSFSLNPPLPAIQTAPLKAPVVEIVPSPIADIVKEVESLPEAVEESVASTVEEVPAAEAEPKPVAEPKPEPKVEKAQPKVEEITAAPKPVAEEKPKPKVDKTAPKAEERESASERARDNRQIKDKREKRIPDGYHYHKPGYYYIPIHRTLAHIAACILLVVIVGLVAIIPFCSSQEPQQVNTASVVPVEVNKEAKKKAEATKKEEKARKERIKAATSARPVEAMTDDGEIVPGANSLSTTPYLQSDNNIEKYYAVVAAFKSDKDVEKYMKQHNEDMAKYKIIRNKNNHLVTVASSNDRGQIESNLPLIRTDYPDAWIFATK